MLANETADRHGTRPVLKLHNIVFPLLAELELLHGTVVEETITLPRRSRVPVTVRNHSRITASMKIEKVERKVGRK